MIGKGSIIRGNEGNFEKYKDSSYEYADLEVIVVDGSDYYVKVIDHDQRNNKIGQTFSLNSYEICDFFKVDDELIEEEDDDFDFDFEEIDEFSKFEKRLEKAESSDDKYKWSVRSDNYHQSQRSIKWSVETTNTGSKTSQDKIKLLKAKGLI